MQWKYIGGVCFLIQNLWLWRDYLSIFRIFVILLMSSVIFYLNSNLFNRNIEEYKRELEQLLGFYLEIPTNLEDENEKTSKNVVDEALTAMKLQLDAAKRERDTLHQQLMEAREEIRKGETKISDITETENKTEDNVIRPSSSSCKFNARNKHLEKQLQVAELQMRQQELRNIAQALAESDLRVERAAEAERKLDQVLKHVVFLEKEKKNAQRRFEHIQKMTNNLSSRLNEMESNYEKTTRHAMKIQESLIKKRYVTTQMLNEAQREARDAKQELEYLRKNTRLVPYQQDMTYGHLKKGSEESTISQVSHPQKTKHLTTIYSNPSDLNKKQLKQSNKSLPSIKPTENSRRNISEDGKFEGAGDRSLCAFENSTVPKSTEPELSPVDAASMISVFSTSSLDKRDKEMEFIWHPINSIVLEQSQRYLDPSPEFKPLLARLEDDGDL